MPVAFNVPAILAPVLVTTNTFATPALEILTLAFATTVTLLLPFVILVELIVLQVSTPEPLVCRY